MKTIISALLSMFMMIAFSGLLSAQTNPAPDRAEGEGPYERLIIRGATMIDGSGYPPLGPVDIVIEGNRIEEVVTVGYPGVPIDEDGRPDGATHEIDAHGMYIMPGFIDMHVHAGGAPKNPDAEYAYKLWLAHGITTVRGVPMGEMNFAISESQRSANNEITAPRIFEYHRPGRGDWEGQLRTPEDAREWVRWAADQGIHGLKLGAEDPAMMEALIDEAQKLGLGTTAHLGQTGVARMNAKQATALGLETITHFYGHFESLLKNNAIQDFPYYHNHQNEQHRFWQVAELWDQIHEPGSDEWNALLQHYLDNNVTMDPTMTIYEASRDVMAARNADWHEKYTLPSMWEFFKPSREAHGSYWFDWGTREEVAWKNYYKRWMQLINDYKNMGGRIVTGSDSGFIYKLYGFGYIEELELLQEAGLNPLEVIQAATYNGAATLHEPMGEPVQFGKIREGLLADLVLIDENPLQNLKVLYGTGAIRLSEDNEIERVGGIKYTIKDGIVYDAKQLLEDVARMVEEQEREMGPKESY